MTNLPITGKFSITATYGQSGSYWKSGHKGIDFVSEHKEVYATCDGTVKVIAYDEGGWGWYISIHDSDGRRHIFCHLQQGSINVTEGDRVDRLTVIAKMGKTGNAIGVHLHFELHDKNNSALDPSSYLGIPNKKGDYYSDSFILEKEDSMQGYSDESSISGWAKDAVEKVSELGIMIGDTNGKFNPNGNITRQEMAVIISRLIERWG